MAQKFIHTLLIIGFALFSTAVSADRIKDLASLAGVRANQLVGYGLVVGLSGSGDKNLGITLQSMQAMLSRFGMSTDVTGLNGSNAAAVMVTAELGPFLKPGQTLDVTVSALGAAESLRGGTLLMTPLLGADGQTYAIAQGNLAVGGLGVQGEDNSSLTVNIPTVGRVPQGATVEKMVETPFLENEYLIFNFHRKWKRRQSRVYITDHRSPQRRVGIRCQSWHQAKLRRYRHCIAVQCYHGLGFCFCCAGLCERKPSNSWPEKADAE